jgi:ABC-2 type transport system permease protein
MSVLFSIAIVILLLAVAAAGGTFLGWGSMIALVAVLVAGSFPFCAMGLFLGYTAGPNSAPAIANLVYLPLAFASGLWIPVEALPSVVKTIAPWLPPYHLAQLALQTIGGGVGAPVSSHLLALGGFTALFLMLARIAYQRDEGKTFG